MTKEAEDYSLKNIEAQTVVKAHVVLYDAAAVWPCGKSVTSKGGQNLIHRYMAMLGDTACNVPVLGRQLMVAKLEKLVRKAVSDEKKIDEAVLHGNGKFGY